MRPQTAMAALFLLMIGSSALLLRSRAHKSEGVAMTVTEQGAPAPQEIQAEPTLDSKQASNAHGARARRADNAPAASAVAVAEPTATLAPTAAATATQAMAAAPAPAPMTATGTTSVLGGGDQAGFAKTDRDEAEVGKELAQSQLAGTFGGASGRAGASNAGPVAGAPRRSSPPPAPATPAAKPRSAPADDDAFADVPKDTEAKKGEERSSDGEAAAAAYRARNYAEAARNYAEAARRYDELAKQGDKHAALQAARSVRELSGCSAAVSRFDALSASAWGTDVGYDATLEAGYCYNALGNTDLARARFSRLLTVSSHAARAQNGLSSLSAVASRKAPAKAAPQATQAPANARPAQPSQQSKPRATATDSAAGF
jgi:hypothetical protein